MKHTIAAAGVSAFLVLSVLVLAFYFASPQRSYGSTIQGNEYTATSTAANAVYGASITDDTLIKTGQGALAQIIITGANTGIFHFYNATTTDVNKRTGNKATSTILIASFPASTATGTYTFDAEFTDGLLLELTSGNMATSTIMYR